MRKEIRLREEKDFRRAYHQGKTFVNNYLILHLVNNRLNINRYGFVISRRLGKAVERNQLKRRLKEICRLHDPIIKAGFDLVIIPRKTAKTADFDTLKRAFRYLLHKNNLFQEKD
ncbi:MAG: ribonuclease P protein component [bacterium]